MAARRTNPKDDPKAAAEYYELKTKAVDDLVNANVTNSPEVSQRELKKYRKRGRFSIPDQVKFFLVKWWIAGVICYFVWLPVQTIGNWELMVFGTGLATGVLMHVIANAYIRMKTDDPKLDIQWMMFPKAGIPWMIANAVYGAVLSLFAFMTYAVIGLNHAVGPVLYGIFVAVWDLIFLGFKRLMLRIIEDAKKKAG